jgi:hypothetical protein
MKEILLMEKLQEKDCTFGPREKSMKGILLMIKGKGPYIWPTGEKYEGDWVDGKMTGKRLYTWSSGQKYEGDFVD